MLLRFRVQPDHFVEMRGDALHPGRAGLLVPVLDAAPRIGDLIRAHGRVADEDHFVILTETVDQVPGRGFFVVPAVIVLPHIFVNEIVEVEVLHVLELGTGRREQLLTDPHMRIHRATHIEEQQHLHRVVALRHHLDVEVPRIAGCGTYGVVEVEHLLGASAGKLAQTAQRNLDVARAQLQRIIQIGVLALVPHLDRTAVATFAPDPDTLRVEAAVAKR